MNVAKIASDAQHLQLAAPRHDAQAAAQLVAIETAPDRAVEEVNVAWRPLCPLEPALLAEVAVERVRAGDAEPPVRQLRHPAAHGTERDLTPLRNVPTVVGGVRRTHRDRADARFGQTQVGRRLRGRRRLVAPVKGGLVFAGRVDKRRATRRPHLAVSNTSLDAAENVHGVALGEPTRNRRLQLLARLDQTHSARRRLAESELGGDAAQHRGGSVIAAHAVERAVVAMEVSIHDLKRRRFKVGAALGLNDAGVARRHDRKTAMAERRNRTRPEIAGLSQLPRSTPAGDEPHVIDMGAVIDEAAIAHRDLLVKQPVDRCFRCAFPQPMQIKHANGAPIFALQVRVVRRVDAALEAKLPKLARLAWPADDGVENRVERSAIDDQR